MRLSTALLTTIIGVAPVPAQGGVWSTRVQGWHREFIAADEGRRRALQLEVRDTYSISMLPLVKQGILDSDRDVRLLAAGTVALHRLPLSSLCVPWLRQRDIESKVAAARALGRVIEPSAVNELARACVDSDHRVRKAAVEALSRYSGEDATRALANALDDSETDVRFLAATSLAQREEQVALWALHAHRTDRDDAVRARIVVALAVLAPADAGAVIDSALRDPSRRVRTSAVDALAAFEEIEPNEHIRLSLLGLVSDEQPLELLGKVLSVLLRSRDEGVSRAIWERWRHLSLEASRDAVQNAVRQIEGVADRFASWCEESAIPAARQNCVGFYGSGTRDAQSLVRLAAQVDRASAIRAAGGIADPVLMDWVLEALMASEPRVVAAALETLPVLLGPEDSGRALEPILSPMVERRGNPALRPAILRAIGRTGATRAWPALEAVLSSSTQVVELVAAIEATAMIPHRDRGPTLVRMLAHTKNEVARAAASVLFSLDDADELLPMLLTMLRRGEHRASEVALAASGLVARAGSGHSIREVIPLLHHLDWGARDALLEGVARNGTAVAMGALKAFLADATPTDRAKIAESLPIGAVSREMLRKLSTDEDPRVRKDAIWNLGRMGRESDVPIIRGALSDASAEIVANALVALGRIAMRESLEHGTIVCPFLEHRSARVREAALSSLWIAQRRCDGLTERRLLYHDSNSQVRRAAARAIAGPLGTRRTLERQALRWCGIFERDHAARKTCLQFLAEAGRGRIASDGPGVLVFDATSRGKGTAVALEGPDGLVRYANTDHRGAVFVPDWSAEVTTLRRPIGLEP